MIWELVLEQCSLVFLEESRFGVESSNSHTLPSSPL